MNRLEFINLLGEKLALLPPDEVAKILDYYVESIDDRMEDGMTEAEAIASLGPLDELAAKLLSEQVQLPVPQAPNTSAPDTAAPRTKKRIGAGPILLLVLGSPIWLSILLAVFSVALSLYLLAWTLVAVLWIVSFALIVSGIGGAVLSFIAAVTPDTLAVRILACGVCLFCAGLGTLLLPASLAATRGFIRLHRWTFRRLRHHKEG